MIKKIDQVKNLLDQESIELDSSCKPLKMNDMLFQAAVSSVFWHNKEPNSSKNMKNDCFFVYVLYTYSWMTANDACNRA